MVKGNNVSGLPDQLGATGPGMTRVLHADDDLDILELAHLALDELGGLEVLQLPSGKDLIETALSFKPDLILLDVMMPDISGEELIAKIKEAEHLKNIPVVFMTAKGNQMAKDSLLALGASAVVIKPFDPLVLADRLREIHGGTATETLS
jgi:CheY-like chemotaxis protein